MIDQQNISKYYDILEANESSTIDEIKQQYRRKAKELHPDRNKKPNAHEQFILLSEAYEYLTNTKSGKPTKKRTQSATNTDYQEWQRKKRDEARRRAAEHARLRYEEFKKTDYYKNSQAALTVFEHLYFLSCLILMLAPFIGLTIKGWAGFGIGMLIAFFTVQYWAGIFRKKNNLNFKTFYKSLAIILKTKTFAFLILTIINLILFFKISLNTQLSLYNPLCIIN